MFVTTKDRAVLFANDFPPVGSGIATAFLNFWMRLPKERVVVIAPRMVGDRAVDAGLPFPVQRINLPRGEGSLSKILKTGLTIIHSLRIAGSARPSCLHCGQVFSSGIAGWICKRIFGIPYVIYVYGSETVRLGGGTLKRLMRATLEGSERVVTNSNATTDEFRGFGVRGDRLIRVYPGVDPTLFQPGPKNPEFLSRYSLEGRRVILTVARLDQRKGHDMVLRALGRLRDSHPDLVYLVTGRGREESRLKALAEDCGVANRVRFIGFVPDEDLPSIYNLCDVFAMPNRVTEGTALKGDVEGFGITFVEAGACAKPVVAGRSGGAIEAVLDGQTGVLVDPHSEEEVAEAIRGLLDNPDEARRLGEAGRLRAEREFDWNRLAKQIEEIL